MRMQPAVVCMPGQSQKYEFRAYSKTHTHVCRQILHTHTHTLCSYWLQSMWSNAKQSHLLIWYFVPACTRDLFALHSKFLRSEMLSGKTTQ